MVLRVLLGLLFVVSAVSKIWSIDQFEVYVYSYGFFPLPLTYVLVRLCIAAELILGVMLLLGWWRRWVRLLTLLMLVAFSLFLCYAALVGRNESCQCFGQLADMNPGESLLKNALLIVLVLAYGKLDAAGECPTGRCRLRLWLTGAIVVAAVVTVFVVSVPDNWMFGNGSTRFNKERIEQTLAEEGPLSELKLTEGHKLAVFVTPGCPYCKMARQKLATIEERHHIASERIVYIEPGAEQEGYMPTDSCTHGIDTELFLKVTGGNRPYIILLEEGEPVVTFHYRNISEKRIARSLKD